LGTITVEIEGTDLPGRRCGPGPEGFWYENIHVGIWRRREAADLVPGDAPEARWVFDLALKLDEAGRLDFGGPYVAGPRDQRYLGLIWVRESEEGTWEVFRGAKFRLYEMERSLFEEAMQSGRRLLGRVGLTDEQGWPRCATVRPPLIEWSVTS
jgi:hypothetical protein